MPPGGRSGRQPDGVRRRRREENEIAGDGGLDRIRDFDKWLEKVQNDLSIDTIDKDRIPATLYLTIRKSDKKIVGNLQIRHFLNEKLLNYGGHIGDSVRPSERRKGYATEQIRLALKKMEEYLKMKYMLKMS